MGDGATYCMTAESDHLNPRVSTPRGGREVCVDEGDRLMGEWEACRRARGEEERKGGGNPCLLS